MPRMHPGHTVAILAISVAACALPREPTPSAPSVTKLTPKESLGSEYERLAMKGEVVYRIDPARSLVTITVLRGGSLARLGHDHIVASHDAQGYIAPMVGRADLSVALDRLSVDEPALREAAHLDTQPSESDIAGTRSNMLDKVLEVQQFPAALIQIRRLADKSADSNLPVSITLHGVTRTFETKVELETGADEMTASGTLEFNQSDFGIVPFSILGGAISVQDHLSARFALRAHRSGGVTDSL